MAIYNLVKCEICGTAWDEHDAACPGHRHRAARMIEFSRLEDERAIAPILVNGGASPRHATSVVSLLKRLKRYLRSLAS